MNVETLLSLNEDKFREVVDSEVRAWGIRDPEQTPSADQKETARALRDPRLSRRWGDALLTMKKSVESQLGAKRADLGRKRHDQSYDMQRELQEYYRWRAGALRFKSGVEERLLEVRSQIAVCSPDVQRIKQERNDALVHATKLQQAIAEHKSHVLSEYEASDADLELWDYVNGQKTRS